SPALTAALTASSRAPHCQVPCRVSISDQLTTSLTAVAPASRRAPKSAPSAARNPTGTGGAPGAAAGSAGQAAAATMSARSHGTCRISIRSFPRLASLCPHRASHSYAGRPLASRAGAVSGGWNRNAAAFINSTLPGGGGESCMWERPKAISIVAGSGEGRTELTAFDCALMDAGIANLNFLRVTSILPAGIEVVAIPTFVPGTLVPAVYARIASHTPGERIAAILYVGRSAFQHIQVATSRLFGRMLILDDAIQTTERDEYAYHEMLAHLPLITHPAPQRALIIGGGDGGTLEESLKHPLQHVTMVEIDRDVVDV